MSQITPERHLKNAQDRAHDFVAKGDLYGAVQSFNYDVGQHHGTKAFATPVNLSEGRAAANTGQPAEVRKWIDGFNLDKLG